MKTRSFFLLLLALGLSPLSAQQTGRIQDVIYAKHDGVRTIFSEKLLILLQQVCIYTQ